MSLPAHKLTKKPCASRCKGKIKIRKYKAKCDY